MKIYKTYFLAVTFIFALLLAGCHNQKPVAKVTTPPPTVTSPSPAAELTVTPVSVKRGGSAQLSWKTQNATSINIDGVGPVQSSGSMNIKPQNSTTYRLTAKGDGGTTEASARLTVTVPRSNDISAITDEQLFAQSIKDVFFGYDNAEIRPDQAVALNADAEFLASHPNIKLLIEGHCDERGSEDYNMGLGENRATAVRGILAQHGVGADRIRTISYGKERPFCTRAEDESCWQQNRRAHFVFEKQQVATSQ